MEENDYGGAGMEFLQKVDVDRGRGLRATGFVEEDADSFDGRDRGCAKGGGKMKRVRGVRRRSSVR